MSVLSQPHARLFQNCRVCGDAYNPNEVGLLDESDQGTVAHATCSKCAHATLLFLGKTDHGIGCLGLATDLNREDAERFQDKPALSESMLLASAELISKGSRNLVAYIYYQSLLK